MLIDVLHVLFLKLINKCFDVIVKYQIEESTSVKMMASK